jgi:Lon-like protease
VRSEADLGLRRETDLPPPFDVRPVKPAPIGRWIVTILLVIGLAIAAFLVPIPIFLAYLPGPVQNVEPLVAIEGAETFSSEGGLLMTTVSVDVDVTFFELVRAVIDRNAAVVMREDVTQGQSFEDLEARQRVAMRESKQAAERVALQALGLARPRSDGVRVEAALPGYPAEGLLEEGDVIERVDGRRVTTTCDVGEAITERTPGDVLTMQLRRGERAVTERIRTAASPTDPEAPFVGVQMSNINYSFEPGLQIDIDTGRIAGPSGGLMMTLAIYDRLTPDDLTQGRKIAGTGEIALCGEVGAIGGIEQKVAGAEREGAEVFLAPEGNLLAAQRAARDIEVVPVASFEDAVDFLEAR